MGKENFIFWDKTETSCTFCKGYVYHSDSETRTCDNCGKQAYYEDGVWREVK